MRHLDVARQAAIAALALLAAAGLASASVSPLLARLAFG